MKPCCVPASWRTTPQKTAWADARAGFSAWNNEHNPKESHVGRYRNRGEDRRLARIKLSEDELEAMVPELNGILAWVEQLGEVDVTGVEPMTAVIPNTLRLRDDVVDADPLTGGGKRDEVLANAPAAEHGFFGVPKVIE